MPEGGVHGRPTASHQNSTPHLGPGLASAVAVLSPKAVADSVATASTLAGTPAKQTKEF